MCAPKISGDYKSNSTTYIAGNTTVTYYQSASLATSDDGLLIVDVNYPKGEFKSFSIFALLAVSLVYSVLLPNILKNISTRNLSTDDSLEYEGFQRAFKNLSISIKISLDFKIIRSNI